MSASSFFIPLRATLFLNCEMYSRRLRELEVLVVDSQAMAWSLAFSWMNDTLNLSKKSLQVPKLGGILCSAFSVSVNAHSPAVPSVMKDRTYAIFLLS